MTMTDAEICKEYREAKRPKQQIGILADLNECTRRDIVKVLVARGEIRELPREVKIQDLIIPAKIPEAAKVPMKEGNLEEPKEPKMAAGVIPDFVAKALFRRLDELEAQIRVREKEYKDIVAYMGIKPGKGFYDLITEAVMEGEKDASNDTV